MRFRASIFRVLQHACIIEIIFGHPEAAGGLCLPLQFNSSVNQAGRGLSHICVGYTEWSPRKLVSQYEIFAPLRPRLEIFEHPKFEHHKDENNQVGSGTEGRFS